MRGRDDRSPVPPLLCLWQNRSDPRATPVTYPPVRVPLHGPATPVETPVGACWRAPALSSVAGAPPVAIPLGTAGHTGSSPSDSHNNTPRPVAVVRPLAGWRA